MQSEFDDSFSVNQSQDGNLFTQIAQTYLPFWPVFVITLFLSGVGTFFYLRYTIPVYQVNAKLLVKDDKNGAGAAQMLDAFDIFGDKKVVDNEIEIIQSSPLMDQVVRDLNLYTTQIHQGNVMNNEVYGRNAPLKITALHKDSVEQVREAIPVEISFAEKRFSIRGKSYPLGSFVRINGQRFLVEKNPNFILPRNAPNPFPILLETHSVGQVSNSLLASLKAEASTKKSTVIYLSMETTVPAKGRDVLNQLFKVYDEFAIEDKNLVAKNTLRFVEGRLGIVSDELEQVEENIKDYKTREGIVNISEQGKLFLESVKEHDQRLSEIGIQLSVLADIESYVTAKKPSTAVVPSLMGINDATLVQLLTKLYETELQLSRVSKVTGGQSDLQEQLRDEIAALKPSILENLGNIRKNLVTAQNNLQGKLKESNSMLGEIPSKEKALVEISRQQVIKNTIYTFLLQKREESALSSASAIADSRVVEPAVVSESPIKPKRNIIYLIGLAIGLGLGVLYVLFKETYNLKVLFRGDIERRVQAPILGELAQGEADHHIVVKDGQRTILAEQFRMLRTNLAYLGLNQPKGLSLIHI